MNETVSLLRHLTDDKVEDVYKENARFDSLLKEYYSDRSRYRTNLQDMWIIVYRCTCNKLKKKYGFIQKTEWIEEKALEVCRIILTRIQNIEKFPNGYVIKNLPTCVDYAILNAVYGSNNQRNLTMEEENTIVDSDSVATRLDQLSFQLYNMYGGWEDELLDRLEREGY